MSDTQSSQQETKVFSRRNHPSGGVSPAARLVSSLDGQYYLLSEVAQILGKSEMTLRRAMYQGRVKAPTKEAWLGKMKVYLYTVEDIRELQEYFAPKVKQREEK